MREVMPSGLSNDERLAVALKFVVPATRREEVVKRLQSFGDNVTPPPGEDAVEAAKRRRQQKTETLVALKELFGKERLLAILKAIGLVYGPPNVPMPILRLCHHSLWVGV